MHTALIGFEPTPPQVESRQNAGVWRSGDRRLTFQEVSDEESKERGTRVPSGRRARLSQLGAAATSLAAHGALEGAKRIFGKKSEGHFLLTAGGAKDLATRLARLRGGAMKVGQMLSLEADDWMPKEVADALARLRADAEPMPREQIDQVMRDGLGELWRERFEHFDYTPLAAASIGQVHRARDRAGRELALKIQYPGVRDSIDSDVDNLAMLVRLSRLLPRGLSVDEILATVKLQLAREADYRIEAEHLARAGALITDGRYVVPGVYRELSSASVLAMDYLPAQALRAGASNLTRERVDQLGAALLELSFRELFDWGFMQSDPNPANFGLDERGRIVLFDYGSAVEISDELSGRYRSLVLAAVRGSDSDLDRSMEAGGMLAAEDTAVQREGMRKLVRIACEPLMTAGAYDFGTTTMADRARKLGFELALKHELRRPPPADMLFVQRKLGGVFFLVSQLGSRVECKPLVELLESPASVAEVFAP